MYILMAFSVRTIGDFSYVLVSVACNKLILIIIVLRLIGHNDVYFLFDLLC